MYGIYDGNNLIATFVSPTTVLSNSPSFVTDSMSLKRSVSKRPAQRWEIVTQLKPQYTDANDIFVMLVTKGLTETITVSIPQNPGARKNRAGNEAVVGSGSINSSTVRLVSENVIPKGTFIKFANHDKVYLTTSARDVSGFCTIFPALISAVVNQVVTWKDDVKMKVYFDDTTITGMVFDNGVLINNGEIKMVEAL